VLTSTFSKKNHLVFLSRRRLSSFSIRFVQIFCHNKFFFLILSQSESLSVIALLNFCLSFPVRIAMPTTISKAVLRNGTEDLVECWGWCEATRFVIFVLLLLCCALLSNLLLILLIGSLILLHICPFFLLNHCDFMGMLLLVYCFGNYFPPKAVFFLLLLLFAAMHYFLSVNSFFLLHAFVPKFVFWCGVQRLSNLLYSSWLQFGRLINLYRRKNELKERKLLQIALILAIYI